MVAMPEEIAFCSRPRCQTHHIFEQGDGARRIANSYVLRLRWHGVMILFSLRASLIDLLRDYIIVLISWQTRFASELWALEVIRFSSIILKTIWVCMIFEHGARKQYELTWALSNNRNHRTTLRPPFWHCLYEHVAKKGRTLGWAPPHLDPTGILWRQSVLIYLEEPPTLVNYRGGDSKKARTLQMARRAGICHWWLRLVE